MGVGRKIKTPSKLKTRGILVKEVDDKRQAFVQTCTIVSAHCNAPLHRIAMLRRGALLCSVAAHCYAPLRRIADFW